VSLGVIPKTGELHRALLSRLPVATGRTLAVSLEPRGGSPSGKPTGPVVTSSALLRAG
jgi:anti-sigma-K factor RskA